MRRIKAFIRKFFSLSRGETNGFLVLVPLMAIVLFSEPVYRAWSADPNSKTIPDEKKLDSLIAKWEWEKTKAKDDLIEATPRHAFLFNPNNTSKDRFIELGFSQSLAQRIINYRAKGGTFKVRSDLKKIYGIDTVLYEKLISFIDLPEKIDKPLYAEKKPEFAAPPKVIAFDINSADTSQLKKIYGIGNVLSVRIITYRDLLGGFVSLSQLKEVYGLDSTVLKNLNKKIFIASEFQVKTMDVNQASEKELARHPYIKSRLAKAITAYRFQHGNFAAIEDLQKIALIDKEAFGRIKPYLILNK